MGYLMTNDERTESQTIANKNRLEETILDLAEWELVSMDYTSLQEYYIDAKIEYYHNNPEGLQDMLQYMKECTDPDTVFNWDVEKKDNGDVEQVEQLVEWVIDSMDMSALENYAKQQLEEYYLSPEGVEDFNTNYEEMREIKGDE